MLKYVDEYRNAELAGELSQKIKGISTRPFNIMEVCGGHTMSIRKSGIQKIVGGHINLVSGPGCPVCVTSIEDIEKIIALSEEKNAAIATFGDLFYVPGKKKSLADKKAEGSDVRIVYSVSDVLKFAKKEPGKDFIFISIGFETTTPTVAAAVKQAKEENIKNFFILSLNKTMPNALRAVLAHENSKIDALICPGHVSTITGTEMYKFLVEKLGVSCCISGFEPLDILRAIYVLTENFEKGRKVLANAYERAVREKGNIKAKLIMEEVFAESDASWRGFGVIPGSGLRLKKEYSSFDAEKHFDIEIKNVKENPECKCGDILRGFNKPADCSLFKTACTPDTPKGACMVSSEGACAAWYRYGE